MKAEIGVMLRQTKEPQGSPANPRSGEKLEQTLPYSLRRDQHLDLGLLGSGPGRQYLSAIEAASLWCFAKVAPGH